MPSAYSAKCEGGNDNQIVATNKKTGEVIVFARVKGVFSQKQLDKNMKKTDEAQSKYNGKTNRLRRNTSGYKHSHVTIYKNAQDK